MKKQIFVIVLIVICLFSTQVISADDQVIYEMFSINILSPNTSAERNLMSLHIEQKFPEIGIGVAHHESTGWGNIGPRTWAYPLLDYDYIPTYDEGGYDIVIVGWSWGFDWIPEGKYDSASIHPIGDNHYQYENSSIDSLIQNYMVEFDDTTRYNYAKQIQKILYDDLPAICLIYPSGIFGYKQGLNFMDFYLLSSAKHRPEYWNDPVDNMIKYAIPADLREPNIFVASSFYDRLWMQAVYGSLFQRERGSHDWVPQIAKNISISEIANKLDVTIFLDPNAKFSDNEAVLPEDIKYSYELFMDPNVVGESDSTKLTAWIDSIDDIEILNNVVGGGMIFHLNTNKFHFYNLFSYGIIDKHAPGNTGVKDLYDIHGVSIFNDVAGPGNAVTKSCGPFIVNSFSGLYSIVHMIPNSFYNRDAPLLDDLYVTYISSKATAISELEFGNIDIIDSQFFLLQADIAGVPGTSYEIIQYPTHQEISVNMRHPIIGTGELTPLGTPEAARNIRKAISHMINRTYFVKDILEGLGEEGVTPMPEMCPGFDYSLQPYKHNITLARSYMEAAGYDLYSLPTTPTDPTDPTATISYTNLGLILIAVLGLSSILKKRNR